MKVMSENMIPTLMLLSGAFVGFVEIAIAVRFMSRCEEWQRIGMLACGVACIVFVAWGCLNVFAPNLLINLISNEELLRQIRFKWYYIANAVENFVFGIVLYTVVSQND